MNKKEKVWIKLYQHLVKISPKLIFASLAGLSALAPPKQLSEGAVHRVNAVSQ